MDINYDIFKQKVDEYLTVDSELRGTAMTLAQQLIQKGIQKGESILLLRQLQRKFHEVPNFYKKKTLTANEETLLIWGERIVEANTLEEVFADILDKTAR